MASPSSNHTSTRTGLRSWIDRQFVHGSNALCQAYRHDTERLHRLAAELERLPSPERHRRLEGLQQWERMQVIDELRHSDHLNPA